MHRKRGLDSKIFKQVRGIIKKFQINTEMSEILASKKMGWTNDEIFIDTAGVGF